MLRNQGEASTAVCQPSTFKLSGKLCTRLSSLHSQGYFFSFTECSIIDCKIEIKYRDCLLQAPKTTLRLIFLNSFKMGVTAALIADALKLQS